MGSLLEPNDHQPLTNQFELFLNQFNQITQTVFIRLHLHHYYPHLHHQLLVLISCMRYHAAGDHSGSRNLLEITSKHGRNSKKFKSLSHLIQVELQPFQKKLDQIFAIKTNSTPFARMVRTKDFGFDTQSHHVILSIDCPIHFGSTSPVDSRPRPANQSFDRIQLTISDAFPTEDVIRRGRMGQEMSAPVNGAIEPPIVGMRLAHSWGIQEQQMENQANAHLAAYPTMPPRRLPPPPLPEADDDLFDLDLNPDL
ncbi:hypothetical protein PSTT_17017, partial [Puccinia striiformis]